MKKIVCLSTSPWYPIPTRKQQVMGRIPDAEILYFDPPVTLLAPLKDRAAWHGLFAFLCGSVKPKDNITVYRLPPVLPFFNRFRWINKLNQVFQAQFVRGKMKKHGFSDPVLWVYSPTACDAVRRIPHSMLVYDCVDRHSAYGGQMSPAVVDAMEADLARRCDRVFATAKPLADRLAQYNADVRFIPNGADFERFNAAASPLPCPSDLAEIPAPRFGFVGALQPCIAYDYLSAAAHAYPESHFVLIGGEKPGSDFLDLKTLPNVHFLGLRKNEDLPAYLANFDALLNLFAENDLSKDVSPLKFYEYLATGKPILSTPQPEQVMQYRDIICVADSAEAFVAACANVPTDEESRAARIEAGRQSSWDARVAQLCAAVWNEK